MNNIDLDHKVAEIKPTLALQEIAPEGRVGIVALSTDYNLEQDIRRMLPSSVEVFTNRVMYKNPMTRENLLAMAGDIGRAAEGILPGLGVDVAIYGCTSGTTVIGYDRIAALIHGAHPGIPVTTPFTAGLAALTAVGAKKISVLTPYDRQINNGVVQSFQESGFDVLNLNGLGFDNDIDVTRINPDDIVQLGQDAMHPDADALFISCTAFRASLAIHRLESALQKPVVSSNQALAWHVLQLLQATNDIDGFGILFAHRL